MSTIRCACRALNRYDCVRVRYRLGGLICDETGDEPYDDEECECSCHDEQDDADEGLP